MSAERNAYQRDWYARRKASDPEYGRDKSKRWSARFPDKVRDKNLQNKYGITQAAYVLMLESQAGRCAICNTDKPMFVKGGGFVVDHCHVTGRVRQLLCGKCNLAIGYLDDDPSLCVKASDYLKKHKETK